jgi:glycosyltransferase involved in cell wall biosynthesis
LETTLAPPLYRRAETVTLCEDSRSDLLGLGWNSSNVHIAYAGLDSFFAPGGTKTEHPSVIAVGRLAPVKRLPDLLEQFRIVHERVPDASLTIVGEGPERSRLENWIASHGAHSWIRLLGRVDKETLRSLYQSSWLITSASLAEGWGMTLTEAAGCGTPAVATDIGGHRSSVRRGVTGTLVDLNELGEAMIEILEDDVRRRRMADESLRWARSLSWDELATRVLRPLYRQVVSR